ncbi:MAG: hypothetical protein HW421_2901 [Ignavibacteria bacterium]|nr:hypothetical protein [Ignavibacteria bacterium]
MITLYQNFVRRNPFLQKSSLCVLITIFMTICIAKLHCQSFEVSPVSSGSFPKVGVTISATDAFGNPYDSLSVNNFTILENGINMSASMSMTCRKDTIEPELSVILLIDNTASMTWPDSLGGKRFEWVLQGAEAFIKTIKFTGRTKVAIMTFNNSPSVLVPFTNKRDELLDSLKYIKWGGQTFYEEAFIKPLPDTGAAFYFDLGNQPKGMKRVIVFLTDGDPTREPNAEKIIKACNDNTINVYSLTLAFPMNDSLAKVSKLTGGKSYEVHTKDETKEIYYLIAMDLMSKKVCDLSWISSFSCTELDRIRDVSVTFKMLKETKSRRYTAPPISVAKIELSNTILSFGDPPANTSVLQTVVITARNQRAVLTGIEFKPPGYFQVIDWGGSPPPYLLDTNQSRTITIQFNQAKKGYRYCTATIKTSTCDQDLTLVGGLNKILLIEPQSGGIYSSCDDGINIKWAGVDPATKVTISYSTNSGISWRLLKNNATGLSFIWDKNYNPPPPIGKNLRVKVTVTQNPYFMAAVGFGDVESEKGLSLALTKDGHYVYAGGYFDSTFNIGTQQLETVKYRDGFLVQFDENLIFKWANKIGSPGRDSITGVCVDADGNAIVTGVCYSGVVFGIAIPSNLIDDKPYCFVAKFRKSDGSVMNYAIFGADNINPNFEIWGKGIKHDFASGKTYIYGGYRNKFSSKNPNRDPNINLTYAPPKPGDSLLFWAVLKPNFDWDTLQKINFPNYAGYSTTTDTDANGNIYGTGGFRRDTSFGTINLKNHGLSDAYIYKYGGTQGGADSCLDFSMVSPSLSISSNAEDFGDCKLWNPVMMKTPITITYNGPPQRISFLSDILTGNNAGDFRAEPPLTGTTINSGETKQLVLYFTPSDIGHRAAQYTIRADCMLEQAINLVGTGLCTFQINSFVDMGKVEMNRKMDSSFICVLKNVNPPPYLLICNPKIVPSNTDFQITDLQGNPISQKPLASGECMDIKITFRPTGIGLSTTRIDYQMPDGCYKEFTTLKGEGINTTLVESDNEERTILVLHSSGDNLYFSINRIKGLSAIKIYNIFGEKVFESEFKPRIDVNFLNTGIYFLNYENRVYKFIIVK